MMSWFESLSSKYIQTCFDKVVTLWILKACPRCILYRLCEKPNPITISTNINIRNKDWWTKWENSNSRDEYSDDKVKNVDLWTLNYHIIVINFPDNIYDHILIVWNRDKMRSLEWNTLILFKRKVCSQGQEVITGADEMAFIKQRFENYIYLSTLQKCITLNDHCLKSLFVKLKLRSLFAVIC